MLPMDEVISSDHDALLAWWLWCPSITLKLGQQGSILFLPANPAYKSHRCYYVVKQYDRGVLHGCWDVEYTTGQDSYGVENLEDAGIVTRCHGF